MMRLIRSVNNPLHRPALRLPDTSNHLATHSNPMSH
jgi:hypothetical protein